jgi:polyisoprenoid-binding protein YceI
MPQGDKSSYTDKQKRQAAHIEAGYEKKGVSVKNAEARAWEASLTLDRRDFDITADQGLVGNSVDVLINVEADLRKPAPAKP